VLAWVYNGFSRPGMKNIIFASNNNFKVNEIRNLLDSNIKLLSLKDIGFNGEIPETCPTIEENALQKARFIHDKYKKPCFADDTGLEVEMLNNEPGVYSARYAGIKPGLATNEEITEANIKKLLLNLNGVGNRSARFKTVIALIIDEKEFLFEGIARGKILKEKKGTDGFGYDPVFLPEGYDKSFAEMPLKTKNSISHRAKAVNKLVEFINKY